MTTEIEHKFINVRLPIIMQHRWKRFRLLVSMVPFRGLSVCLSVTFVHCGQTAEEISFSLSAEEISFAYDSSMFLPDRFRIWLTSVNRFLSKFCPKVTRLLLIWASETFEGKLRPNG